MAQVAERYGVTVSAIWRWLKNHDLLEVTERDGKYRYLSVGVLKRYLRETQRDNVQRVATRPEGYIGLYEAAEIFASHISVIYRATKRGDVAAVRVGQTNYYCEADVRKLAESLENTPPNGWRMVKEHALGIGADPSTVTRWLKRHSFPTGKYRDPNKQVAVYAEPASLEAWERHYAAYKGAAA